MTLELPPHLNNLAAAAAAAAATAFRVLYKRPPAPLSRNNKTFTWDWGQKTKNFPHEETQTARRAPKCLAHETH